MKHIHTEITFILIGEHPHAGENAHPVGETVNTITRETLYGKWTVHTAQIGVTRQKRT
jgi:hypothetical protein